MQAFNRFGSSEDPWFRIGNVDVNTTTLITGLGVLSMLVWAVAGSGGLFGALQLVSDDVTSGQIWRLVTWPIPNVPDIWTVILLAVFYMLGSQLEASMGRRLYAILLGAMTVIPAVLFVVVSTLLASGGGFGGLRWLELGVLCAFAAKWPNAQFFFGIPAWVIAGVIVFIDVLQLLRTPSGLVLLIGVVGIALVGIRSMGFAEEVTFIPKLPLPASLGGESRPAAAKKPKRSSRRNAQHLSAVPNPAKDALDDREIDALLDQVSTHGLDSLTSAQRKRLEQHSKKLRKRRDG